MLVGFDGCEGVHAVLDPVVKVVGVLVKVAYGARLICAEGA